MSAFRMGRLLWMPLMPVRLLRSWTHQGVWFWRLKCMLEEEERAPSPVAWREESRSVRPLKRWSPTPSKWLDTVWSHTKPQRTVFTWMPFWCTKEWTSSDRSTWLSSWTEIHNALPSSLRRMEALKSKRWPRLTQRASSLSQSIWRMDSQTRLLIESSISWISKDKETKPDNRSRLYMKCSTSWMPPKLRSTLGPLTQRTLCSASMPRSTLTTMPNSDKRN